MSINKIIIRIEDTPTPRFLPPASISSLSRFPFLSTFKRCLPVQPQEALCAADQRPTDWHALSVPVFSPLPLIPLWASAALICRQKEVGIVHYPLAAFDSESRNWSGLELIFLLWSTMYVVMWILVLQLLLCGRYVVATTFRDLL